MESLYGTRCYEKSSASERAASRPPVRLYILHKLPTPYNDMFFRAMHDDEGIELSVYHLWRGSWRRPWKSELGNGYPNTYMRLKLGIDWNLLRRAWSDGDSFFLVADWAHLASVIVILARLVRSAPVGIWADTPQEHLRRPFPKGWLRRAFLKWLLPKVDVVFGTGQRALDVLASMGAKREQLVSLPCFVDLGRPAEARRDTEICAMAKRLRERVGCGDDGVVFSMMGTLIEKKGNDTGLQAFARCREQSRKPVGLLIAGEGPEREKLEQLAAELNLGDSVAFLGWQEPHEMDAAYLASDCVLHPARYDPFPLVVLETMSWSRVIVGSDVCGSVEDRVRHGVNGFSFPSGDVPRLAELLVDICNRSEQLAQIGRQARKTAEAWPVSYGVEIIRKQAREFISPLV